MKVVTNLAKRRGIRTAEDLRGRCWVDDDTGCWHWRGARSHDAPAVCLPGHGRACGLGRVIGYLKTGTLPPPGVFWSCICATKHCANPAHRAPGTRSAAMKRAIPKRGPAFVARVQAAKRAASTICTPEIAAAIRASDEPCAALGLRYGMSGAMAWKIKRGLAWLPTLPAASVFSWRPPA